MSRFDATAPPNIYTDILTDQRCARVAQSIAPKYQYLSPGLRTLRFSAHKASNSRPYQFCFTAIAIRFSYQAYEEVADAKLYSAIVFAAAVK